MRWGAGFTRAGDIRDGLSSTCLAAEIRRATGEMGRLVTYWNSPRSYTPGEFADLQTLCSNLPDDPAARGWRGDSWARGLPWTAGSMGYMLYNHALPPNRPSCLNGTEVATGMATASSYHRRGVHVVFCDGHVDFIADDADPGLWSRLGSRNDAG